MFFQRFQNQSGVSLVSDDQVISWGISDFGIYIVSVAAQHHFIEVDQRGIAPQGCHVVEKVGTDEAAGSGDQNGLWTALCRHCPG